MSRFKAERAKRKVDPLIEHGHKVFIAYDNSRAFETRKVSRTCGKYGEKTYQTTRSRLPSKELLEWMEKMAGPRGILWTTEKSADYQGIDIYFYKPDIAMMAKLTWGGV